MRGDGGGVREQQSHAEEHGDRHVRVDEKVAAGRGVVDRTEDERRRHGGQGHRRDAEQELPRHSDEEDREIHVRRIELGFRDQEAPRHVGRIEEQQEYRHHRQRERRGVEDVRVHAVALPAQELLRDEADRHHHELPIEPRVLEPEEQREAEDDGKRAEAQSERAAVRPRQEAVETVGEQQLRNDQRRRVVHLAPVEAPIEDQRALQARLQVVLRAQRHFERHRLPAPQDPKQQRAPREQHHRGADDRGAHDGPRVQQRELAQHQQADDERGVHEKRAARRTAGC